jgi:putative heme-binding domain-containing protein
MRLAEVWGELRDSPQDKAETMDHLKQTLTADYNSPANVRQGRALFQSTCAKCHKLFGAGENIGPDLTGSDRRNLDYLLSNVVDPSAVVNKDYRMTVVHHADGRVLNGIIVSQDDARIVLQTADEKMTILRDDVDEIVPTTLSAMPDGILQPLSDTQIRDLIAYLMGAGQVELPPTNAIGGQSTR